jgi:hypothetical protein
MDFEKQLEFNKKCAEFIGACFYNDDIEAYPNGYWMLGDPEYYLPSELKDMEFHSDWNV